MAFIYGEKLLEFAIRVAVDDFRQDPTLIDMMFYTDPAKNEGEILSPDGVTPVVREQLPTDYFQARLSQIRRVNDEIGMTDIFVNPIPATIDIKAYLSSANIRITTGYPRENADIPCLAIILGDEKEKQYLGVRKGQYQSQADATKRYEIIGSDWNTTYSIHVITPNHEETIIWNFILKYAFTKYRIQLEAYGLREISLQFSDVVLAPEFLQAGLYIYQRSCFVNCMKDEDIVVPLNNFTELAMGDVTVIESQERDIDTAPESVTDIEAYEQQRQEEELIEHGKGKKLGYHYVVPNTGGHENILEEY